MWWCFGVAGSRAPVAPMGAARRLQLGGLAALCAVLPGALAAPVPTLDPTASPTMMPNGSKQLSMEDFSAIIAGVVAGVLVVFCVFYLWIRKTCTNIDRGAGNDSGHGTPKQDLENNRAGASENKSSSSSSVALVFGSQRGPMMLAGSSKGVYAVVGKGDSSLVLDSASQDSDSFEPSLGRGSSEGGEDDGRELERLSRGKNPTPSVVLTRRALALHNSSTTTTVGGGGATAANEAAASPPLPPPPSQPLSLSLPIAPPSPSRPRASSQIEVWEPFYSDKYKQAGWRSRATGAETYTRPLSGRVLEPARDRERAESSRATKPTALSGSVLL